MIFRVLMSPGCRFDAQTAFAWESAFTCFGVFHTAGVGADSIRHARPWVWAGTACWCEWRLFGGWRVFAVGFLSKPTQDVHAATQGMNQLIEGDLRFHSVANGGDELAALVSATAKMGATVSAMVANVRSNAAFVAHSGQSPPLATYRSDRTEQQAANLEQTAASVQELSSTVQETSQTVLQVNQRAGRVRDVADQGGHDGRSHRFCRGHSKQRETHG